MTDNRSNAELIRRLLTSKRDADAIMAIADQLAQLHELYSVLERRIRQLDLYQEFRAQLIALEDDLELTPQLPSEVDVFAAELMEDHENFYRLEFNEVGIPFRWTGPRRPFSFGVRVNREIPMRVELYILGMIDEQRQQHLRLLVDAMFLPLTLERVARGYLASAVLPAARRQQATELTFIVPETRIPDPNDPRQLGVSFVQLSIRPDAQQITKPAEWPDTAAEGTPPHGSSARQPSRSVRNADAEPTATLPAGDLVVPREILLSAEQLRENHPGFLDLEHAPDGTAFRWTGPGRMFSFLILIDRRTPIALTLRLSTVVDFERQSPLAVEIDNVPYAMSLVQAGADIIGRLVIPPRLEQAATSLSFTVPVLLPLTEAAEELGVAFRDLHLCVIADGEQRTPIVRDQRKKERRGTKVNA